MLIIALIENHFLLVVYLIQIAFVYSIDKTRYDSILKAVIIIPYFSKCCYDKTRPN